MFRVGVDLMCGPLLRAVCLSCRDRLHADRVLMARNALAGTLLVLVTIGTLRAPLLSTAIFPLSRLTRRWMYIVL